MPPPFDDHFSSISAEYAAYRPGYPPELAEYLAALAPARSLALDGGCGTGQFSVKLAAHFARVVATDPSAQQIANAVSHPRIDYRRAPAEDSGLPDASVDLVAVAQAAHWFDLEAFYREVRRVLRPGGAVALIAYGVSVIAPEIDRVTNRFHYDAVGKFWPPERDLVEARYRTLPFPFAEIEPPEFALRERWPLAGMLGYVDTWSAVRNAEKQLGLEKGRALFDAFARDLAAAWGDPAQARDINWPVALRIGRV